MEQSKSKSKKYLIWSLNVQSKTLCSIMIAFSLCATIGLAYFTLSNIRNPEGLLYLTGCFVSIISAIGFRLLRNICKAIITILDDDSDRDNTKDNERQ